MNEKRIGKRSWIVIASALATIALMLTVTNLGVERVRSPIADSGNSGALVADAWDANSSMASVPFLPGGSTASAAGTTLRVVTSTSVFADLVANVAGERAEVSSLIPVGADPHTWEPSTAQARALATADVFFYNGLGLEPWAERTITNVGRRDLMAVRLSDGLEPIGDVSFHVPVPSQSQMTSGRTTPDPMTSTRRSADHDDHHHDGDPHFWLDITNAMHYVRRIEQALSAADPSGAAYYEARAEQYLAELEALDRWFAAEIERIPPQRRVLVTYHDAYAYMAERYGLELVGFLVRNPDREPAPREMAELLQTIKDQGVPTIFAEPQVNQRFAETLAREAGVKIGILYTDALTTDAPTYIDMMRANARALVEGLSGDSQP